MATAANGNIAALNPRTPLVNAGVPSQGQNGQAPRAALNQNGSLPSAPPKQLQAQQQQNISSEKTPLIQRESLGEPSKKSTTGDFRGAGHPNGEPQFKWKEVGTFVDSRNPPPFEELKSMNLDSANKTLQNYIMEKYYADLYWNCSLAVCTCIFAWLLARMGGGFFSLCFVLLCSFTVYRTEFRRFNRNLRDDMTRLSAIENLEEKTETMDWLNSFLAKFWVIYMPALSEMVLTQTNTVLKDVAPPPPIDKLSLDEFTLGTKAPKIKGIKSFAKLGKDTFQMDWDFEFAPNDTDGMTKLELKKKVDPKVALGIRVGKGFVGASLPILVEDMSFKGKMRITLQLGKVFPHIKMVSVSFLEPPAIDYALKPVGGNTFGIDIMSLIPGLASFVNSIINSQLEPMLYAPNSLDINVEDIVSNSMPQAIGVLAVKVRGVEYRKSADINPFVEYYLSNDATHKNRTDIKTKTNAAIFNEDKKLLVTSLGQDFILELFDFNDGEPESLGETSFELNDLLQTSSLEYIEGKITKNNKTIGKIFYDLTWIPVLQAEVDSKGQKGPVPESEIGIFDFKLISAKNLDKSKSLFDKLSTFAEVYVDGELLETTRVVKGSNHPQFSTRVEKLVKGRSVASIKIIIKDVSSYGTTTIAEYESSSITDFISQSTDDDDIAYSKFTKGPGTFYFKANWKPLSPDEFESTGFVPPIGAFRVYVSKAESLKNLETLGTIDPRVEIFTGGQIKGYSKIVKDTQNPQFNQVFYVPVTSKRQPISIHCSDVDNGGKKTRLIGKTKIDTSKFFSGDYDPKTDSAKGQIRAPLLNGKGDTYGYINYKVVYCPLIPVYTQDELNQLTEVKEEDKEAELEDLEKQAKLLEAYKKKPSDYEWYTPDSVIAADVNKVQMPLEELLSHNSGVLGITVLKGQVKYVDSYVQCLVDDYSYPGFTSKISSGKKLRSSAGSVFIRDLQNSILTFRVTNTENVITKKDVVASTAEDIRVIDLVKSGEPLSLDINGNKVDLIFEYIPAAVSLGPTETLADTGVLDLTIVGCKGLKGVDRSGTSDPYVLVTVDGNQIHKTQTVKKSLEPTFNENVKAVIPSRTRTALELGVFDWDKVGENKKIGSAFVDSTQLPSNREVPIEIQLDTQGTIQLAAKFIPKYIKPVLTNEGELDLLGAPFKLVGGVASVGVSAVTGVAGVGASAVTGVAGVGVSAVAGVAGGLKKGLRFGRKSTDNLPQQQQTHLLSVPNGAGGGDSSTTPDGASVMSKQRGGASVASSPMKSRRVSADIQSFASTSLNGNAIPGRLTINGLSGIEANENLIVRVLLQSTNKSKEIYKTRPVKVSSGEVSWKESVAFKSPAEAKMIFIVKTHHRLGKDSELGVSEILLSETAGKAEDFEIPLNNGKGSLSVNFRYSIN